MSGSQFEISEWRDEGPRKPETPAPRERTRWPSTWIGLFGTVVLHGLILQSIPIGSHARQPKPQELDGATVDSHQGTMAETLILLDLTTMPSNRSSLNEEIASQSASVKTVPLTILSTYPLPAINIPTDPSQPEALDTTDSGDPALRAALFGRYTGQLDARIERLWKRPRSAIAPPAVAVSNANMAAAETNDVFRCQVKIIQASDGQVLEVQLLQCNDSAQWRQSLVSAIFYASPLPAPPTPSVFTRSLIMSFTGYAYSPGASDDAYERATATPSS